MVKRYINQEEWLLLMRTREVSSELGDRDMTNRCVNPAASPRQHRVAANPYDNQCAQRELDPKGSGGGIHNHGGTSQAGKK